MTDMNIHLKRVIEQLNITILSMAAKQQLFDNLESELISMKIYTEYIDLLIDINLKLMKLYPGEDQFKNKQYEKLIQNYISNNDNDIEPDKIIQSLVN